MAESYRCPQCGAEVPGDAPQGLCPNCVLKAGFGTQQTGSVSQPGSESASASPFDAQFVPPTTDELAPHFPDLEILELVGRGGMGVVYKARQKRLDRLVALKILSPRIGQDPAFAERFVREARAMAMLSHPHIVAVHDFGQTDRLYYFLMEFCDGVNLRRLLDTGKLAPEEALAIVPQICEALQYAHDHGVVHRDIKPENVLLDKEGRVKIADFGLAKLMGREAKDFTLTGVGQIMGTPQYMAPEQIEHPQDVDHRADIYSLGVVFYQMLTGELPVGRFAPPSKRVQIDVRLDEVVLRALEKDPAQRYQQASELKTRVETIATTPALSDRGASSRTPLDPKSPSTGGPWQWADTLAMLAGMTFTSALARKVANASAVGFLGFLACLGFLPVPGMRWCFGFSGFFGFFGLIGIAFIIEYAVRHEARKVAGVNVSVPAGAANDVADRARRQIKGPAIGLLITGLFNWVVAVPIACLVSLRMASQQGGPPRWAILMTLLFLTVLSIGVLVAALKMKRLQGYWMAVVASILAILVSPSNLIGLPIGIWALVVLSQRDVRAAFSKRCECGTGSAGFLPADDVQHTATPLPNTGEASGAPALHRSYYEADGATIARAKQIVNAPAIGLFVTGILNGLVMLVVAPVLVWMNSLDRNIGIPVQIAPHIAVVFTMIFGAVPILAAVKMRRLEGRSVVIAAAIVAMLSLIVLANPLGLVCGIWTFVVLGLQEVRIGFHQRRQQRLSTASQYATAKDTVIGWTAMILCLVGLPIFGYVGPFIAEDRSFQFKQAIAMTAFTLAFCLCEIFALVSGRLCRKSSLGQAAVVGSVFLMATALLYAVEMGLWRREIGNVATVLRERLRSGGVEVVAVPRTSSPAVVINDAWLERRVKGLPRFSELSLYPGFSRFPGFSQPELLDLSQSRVTDVGLEHVEGSTNVQWLNLGDTQISDAGLEHLKGLTNLQSLVLDGTKVTDAGLEHLKGLTKLQSLSLWQTKVTDAGLKHLKGLTNLQSLDLLGTKVTDAGLEHLKALPQLQVLGLVYTKVTDAGLERLKGLSNLGNLDLRATKVTDEGVKKLQQTLPACRISH